VLERLGPHPTGQVEQLALVSAQNQLNNDPPRELPLVLAMSA
jgi:hypothetical protein